MKNNKILIALIILLFAFAFTSKVFAGVTNDVCETLTMSSCAEPNNFQTNIAVCRPEWDGTFYSVTHGNFYSAVEAELHKAHYTQIPSSAGNKGGNVTVAYYYCGGSDENSRISANVTCDMSAKRGVLHTSAKEVSKVNGDCARSGTNTKNVFNTWCPSGYSTANVIFYSKGKYLRVCQKTTCYEYSKVCPPGSHEAGGKCYTCSGITNQFDAASLTCHAACPEKTSYSNGICSYSDTINLFYSTVASSFQYSRTKFKESAEKDCEEILDKIPSGKGYAPINVCNCGWPQYNLDCKKFVCLRYVKETIGVHTQSFKTDNGSPAYCVNPTSGFQNSSKNYQVDKDFDVTNCSTSYSTIDCGYANILIEGNYNNISKKTIELAMRLWGAHSGQGGYDSIGISSYSGSGDSCIPNVTFKSDAPNIYKETEKYIWQHFMEDKTNSEKLKNKTYIDVREATNLFFEISCESSQLSLVCGKVNTYKEAFALFFNTVFGNKYMFEHLDYLFNNEVNTKPTDIEIESEKDSTKIKLVFDRTIKNLEKKQYDCSKIEEDEKLPDNKKNYPELKKEDRNYIKQYCNVKVDQLFLVHPDGTTEEITKDVDNDNKVYDASKGTLIVKSKYYAVCTSENKNRYSKYQVTVKYKKSKSSGSIKKYFSCASNPEKQQFMFADKNSNSNIETGEDVKDYSTQDYSFTINCNGTCTNYNIVTSVPKCGDKDNNIYTGYVKDPSLKCIVNMASQDIKNFYDYSDYFKVNKNLCRVYCSDEVNLL